MRWPWQRPPAALMDYSGLKTDFHSHLIPGVDDGVKSVAEAVEVIGALKRLGYRRLITTPHIRSDQYLNEAADLNSRYAALVSEPNIQALGVPLELAAEYYLDEHFIELLRRDELLSFGERYVLIETNHSQQNLGLREIVEELRRKGYQPILAHPERYAYGWDKPDYFEAVRSWGVRLQVNLTAFSGHYRREILRTAERLAAMGVVDFLGTDCHKMDHVTLLRRALPNPSLQGLLERGVLNARL